MPVAAPRIAQELLCALRRDRQAGSKVDHASWQPDITWVCRSLFQLLAQYPGGLSLPVIHTNLATMSQAANSVDEQGSTLSVHVKGHGSQATIVSATIVDVQCLSPPCMPHGGGSTAYGGGTWVLHLMDSSIHKPLLMYAAANLTPLLFKAKTTCEQQPRQQHVLVGSTIRLAGPLRQPQRVSMRSRHGPQAAARPFLPTRSLLMEVDAADSAVWAAQDLAGHPVLGGMEFTRVYDLSAMHQVVSAIATQDRACVEGWLAVVVDDQTQLQSTDQATWRGGVSVSLRGRGQAVNPQQDLMPPGGSSACVRIPLVLEGEATALASALRPGDELLLYTAVICRGRGGLSSTLELGLDTILVLKTFAPAPGQGPTLPGMEAQASDACQLQDQVRGSSGANSRSGLGASGLATGPSNAGKIAGCVSTSGKREGASEAVVWATLHQVLGCLRKPGQGVQALVVLDVAAACSAESGAGQGQGAAAGQLLTPEHGDATLGGDGAATAGQGCERGRGQGQGPEPVHAQGQGQGQGLVPGLMLALLELLDHGRALQQLREGHALLLVGAQAADRWQLPAAMLPLLQTPLRCTSPGGALAVVPGVDDGAAALGFAGGMDVSGGVGVSGSIGGAGGMGGAGGAGVAGELPSTLLRWRESERCMMTDLTTLPALLNSPSLHQPAALDAIGAAIQMGAGPSAVAASAAKAAGGAERGMGLPGPGWPASVQGCTAPPGERWAAGGHVPGMFVCRVEVESAEIQTQRVHLHCGRPVTASVFDPMDFEEEGDEGNGQQGEPSQGRQGAPAADDGRADGLIGGGVGGRCPVGPGVNAGEAAAGAGQHLDQDMSLDGLWQCAFCGVECSPSGVAFDFVGHLTLRQQGSPVGTCSAPEPACAVAAGAAVATGMRVSADPAALAVLAGTSAVSWRRQGGALGGMDCSSKVSPQSFVASLYAAPGQPRTLQLALLQPLLV